ncbi:MFS transporter [Caldilinea sp.]|uniref:MFS transporter n=2 Tax=Caldilinea sp. TaxID=2293560 RepID=UPI002614D278|nr:MFS transporter [uncultured Caldilinea sp.]
MAAHVRVFVIFTAAYFLSYFYRSANAVIAPDLAQELALDASQLGLMTGLFFAAFAAVQLPLGVGLDRLGPRWVTSALMLVGAAGSLLFASAHSLAALALGRALIGVGMAGVLMGALKAFSQWYSPLRYPALSGLLVGLGSAGALAAATPLAWLNETVGWRAVFGVGAGAVAGVAAAIALGTRNAPPGVPWPGQSVDLRALQTVFGDLRFWRIALLVFFTNGTLLAFQGLWAGPYLNDVYAADALTRGNVLLWLSAGVTVGFLLSGWLSTRLGLANLVTLGAALFIATQVALALHPPPAVMAPVGALFGLSGGLTIMLLVQPRYVFPIAVTGQATTAVNLFAIGGAALVQWWMGLIIGLFPGVDARYPPEAYSAALMAMATGTAAMLMFYWPMRRSAA